MKAKTDGLLTAILYVVGLMVFVGLSLSACGIAAVVPYKLTMNWLGL